MGMIGLAIVSGGFLMAGVALTGATLGSFLALLCDRIPRAENVVSRSSHCETCGGDISWRDKVPLVSWILLRGRCRHCAASIPARLFLAELAGAIIGLGVLAFFI